MRLDYRVTMVARDLLTLFFEVSIILLNCYAMSAQFAAAQTELGKQWNNQI